MSAKILDGKILAVQLKKQIGADHKACVLSLTVGKDPSTNSYLKSQKRTADELGINFEEKNFSDEVTTDELLDYIQQINTQKHIHGVIINKPLPKHLDHSVLINALDASKDIEGLGERNLGRLLLGKTSLIPCTAAAALALLKYSGESLKGKHAVVIGRSEIIGKPISLLLLKEDMTVTVCHSKTINLPGFVLQADVVVAALGQKKFVQGQWIKQGAMIIDVGINDDQGKTVGDVDFDACQEKAAYISPVPGGVGPVTSVMLMNNAIEAFKLDFVPQGTKSSPKGPTD